MVIGGSLKSCLNIRVDFVPDCVLVISLDQLHLVLKEIVEIRMSRMISITTKHPLVLYQNTSASE